MKDVNNFLNKNTEVLLDKSRQDALRDMISEKIISDMKTKSALDVFNEIDHDKDDLIDPSELMVYIMESGIKAKRDEV